MVPQECGGSVCPYQGRRGRVLVVQLDQQGNRLEGQAMRSEDSSSPIENGQFKDGEVVFDVVSEWNGRRQTTRYAGTLDGNTMRGKAEFTRRGDVRTVDWVGTRTTLDALQQDNEPPPVAADIDLTDGNVDVWREHILPAPDELAWAKIAWLTTFQDGILKAEEANKPLLLWTMNGHPLGCT